MIRSFRKFFEFAGRQSRNWYLGLFYEIIRCILEALQFAALLVVLDGLVRDNITAQTALLAFGIMLVSVIGTIIFWYLAHGKEGEGSYRMCEDKRIQIGNRMKYMPMGYFNSHSLGNLTSVSTATMSDLESMSFAIIVRTLVGVIHASIFSVAMCYFSWKISLIFLAGVILFMVINTMLLRCSKRRSSWMPYWNTYREWALCGRSTWQSSQILRWKNPLMKHRRKTSLLKDSGFPI